MSAFLCPDDHFRLIVQWAIQHHGGTYGLRYYVPGDAWPSKRLTASPHYIQNGELEPGEVSPDGAVAMLWQENVNSLLARYPGDEPGFMVEPDAVPPKYIGVHYGAVPPVLVLKAVDCLEYQSCEHAGWDGCEAQRLLNAVRGNAIAELPGYDAAPGWTYERGAELGKRRAALG